MKFIKLCSVQDLPWSYKRKELNTVKRPAWPHRPVCGTLSQNGYGTDSQQPCVWIHIGEDEDLVEHNDIPGWGTCIKMQSKRRRQRPYRVECTGSLPNSEVKRRRARLVLGWGTAREDLRVLLAFLIFTRWSMHTAEDFQSQDENNRDVHLHRSCCFKIKCNACWRFSP